MSQRPTSRPAAPLPPKTEKTLFTYAAAGAAGVGILALAQPSEAKIVYTPAHTTVSPDTSLKIDLNADGQTDFTLTEYGFAGGIVNTGSTHSSGFLNVNGALSANQVIGSKNPVSYAAALAARVTVGASDHFLPHRSQLMEGCLIMQGSSVVRNGKWIGAKNKYLGLKFSINGQPHFGWARLSVKKAGCVITTLLTGYAYETVANKSIETGKTTEPAEAADLITPLEAPLPVTLGVLAQGAPGLSIWRREEELQKT